MINLLNNELQFNSRSRAALSLLGFCYYQIQDFEGAAECYDGLSKFYPENTDYKLYHAQALYKGNQYEQALKVCQSIEDPNLQEEIIQLQIAIQYELEEVSHARTLSEHLDPGSSEAQITEGCLLFKEEKFEEAR